MTETFNPSLKGLNILLEGPTGTGKTHSLGTLVDSGIEVFYFAFEAGAESLLGYWVDKGKEVPKNLHITTVHSASASWGEMADSVGMVNRMSYESLKKMNDPHRAKYDQLEKFLRTFNDVTDDQGNHFGCVDEWGTDKAIVIDGLTGLGNATMKTVIGGKADRDQKDWGLAQNLLEGVISRLCNDCKCHFILLAHVEREVDEVLGGVKLMTSTLGKKLPPKLPPMFSDVILTVREGTKWSWSTANPLADLKTRNLPVADNIAPDFTQIITKWKLRGAVK